MVIGLTGGIACGKSTAAKMIEGSGYKRIDCDEIVHELLAADASVAREIRNRFGSGAVTEHDGVDRSALGRIVFNDSELLAALESILHPRVHRMWTGEITRDPASDWVVEIPLLFEKNLQKNVDFTVCVFSDLKLQVERLERKGMDRASALARIRSQLPLAAKAEMADFVLLNDGSLVFLERQVERLLRDISK